MEPGNRKILVYQPAYIGLVGAVVAVLLASAGWLLYRHGLRSAGSELVVLERSRDALEQEVEALQDENATLRQQLAVTQRSSEIDRHATLELRNAMGDLREDSLALQKELDFYRGIVSPKDGRSGLNIERFAIQPGTAPGHYLYSLVLTQLRNNQRYVNGVVDVAIEGLQDGRITVLPLTSLAPGEHKPLKYKFRYFQDFAGEIKIPKGFEPKRVKIRLVPGGKGQPRGVEKSMDWPV